MQEICAQQLVPERISRHGTDFPFTVRVTPGLGANLVSFEVDGIELIHWDTSTLPDENNFTGAFTMFPTPCRLDNCSYDFEGQHIVQRKRDEDVFIHGLVRDEMMAFETDCDRITCWLDITPEHPVYEGFPYSCRFTVEHELHAHGLTVRFRVRNNDTRNIPCGYGIHPYWRIHGDRADVIVRIPCDRTLDLANLVPTGRSSSVAGTDLDLREGRNIDGLFIDNVFWPRQPGDSAEVLFRAIAKRLVIEAGDNFPHMIVYAPEGKPFLCVENLTTTPNAPNLVTAGHADVASMLIVPPGESVEGWIKYSVLPM